MKVPAAKKLPSGQWNVQIQINGKRHSVTRPTKKEAERAAAGLKAGFLKARPGAVTLEQAIDTYIAARSNVLSPSTVRSYDIIKRRHFQTLMRSDIYSINQIALQTAVNAACAVYSAKTVCNTYGLIHAALRFYGVSIEGVQLPQKQPPSRRWLQAEEVRPLMDALRGDKCELPILLALWLGMRRSEIMGLCWDCVDIDRSLLTVRRSYVYVSAGTWTLREATKTRGSHRVIPLPAYIVSLFETFPHNGDRVFSQFDPGLPRKRLQRLCEQTGVTLTHLHGLRHTFATIMLREGVPEQIVMRQGGWTDARTLRGIYDYVMDADNISAKNARDAFFDHDKNADENAYGK